MEMVVIFIKLVMKSRNPIVHVTLFFLTLQLKFITLTVESALECRMQFSNVLNVVDDSIKRKVVKSCSESAQKLILYI